jgi:hypothetical protein
MPSLRGGKADEAIKGRLGGLFLQHAGLLRHRLAMTKVRQPGRMRGAGYDAL